MSQCIYIGFELYYTNGNLAFPLDDSWIHLTFAKNFSDGFIFQYNPGEFTTGSTSPLWVIILGSLFKILPYHIFLSIFLSFVFFLLSVIYTYKISLLIFKNLKFENYEFLSVMSGILLILNGRFNWASLSGMETTMFAFFCLLSVYSYLNKPDEKIKISIFLALASLSRPEGYLLSLIILFYDIIKNRKFNSQLIIGIIIYLILVLPYPIFSKIYGGSFTPNTFEGQGGFLRFIPDFNYLRIIGIYFFRDNLITGLLWILSFIFFVFNFRNFRSQLNIYIVIFLWLFLLPIFSSVLIPNWRHHSRYTIPLTPFISIVAVYTFNFIYINFLKDIKFRFNKIKYFFYIILFLNIPYYFVYAFNIGLNTSNINDQQVKIAKWVSENIDSDTGLAVNDIGAIGYYTDNKLIDMAGLITPELFDYRKLEMQEGLDSLESLYKRNNVGYVIIYDHWFPDFLEKRKDNLEFIKSEKLKINTICGGEEMKIYKYNYQSK